MDKEHQDNLDYTGFSESKLDKQTDLSHNYNLVGSILFSSNPKKPKNPFCWIRIRSFFIKHTQFQRLMEFSCHPTGIHMLRLAALYSESGCPMCKFYVEKNLF